MTIELSNRIVSSNDVSKLCEKLQKWKNTSLAPWPYGKHSPDIVVLLDYVLTDASKVNEIEMQGWFWFDVESGLGDGPFLSKSTATAFAQYAVALHELIWQPMKCANIIASMSIQPIIQSLENEEPCFILRRLDNPYMPYVVVILKAYSDSILSQTLQEINSLLSLTLPVRDVTSVEQKIWQHDSKYVVVSWLCCVWSSLFAEIKFKKLIAI